MSTIDGMPAVDDKKPVESDFLTNVFRYGLGGAALKADLEESFDERIAKAVAAEREACAKIADAHDKGGFVAVISQAIAKEIRARGKK